jgi:hypothetical protein
MKTRKPNPIFFLCTKVFAIDTFIRDLGSIIKQDEMPSGVFLHYTVIPPRN